MKLTVFAKCEPIDKGWSGDRKYHVVTREGAEYLLRVTPAARRANKRTEFEMMAKAAALGVPMCRAVGYGVFDEEHVYMLQTWIRGVDAEAIIPTLDTDEQFRMGVEAGRALAVIHKIPAPVSMAWGEYFGAKMDRRLKSYAECPLKYEYGDKFIGLIGRNRHLIEGRPVTWQHGDFHIGNLMVTDEGRITVIDFDRADTGDPWEEFNRIVWSAQCSGAFAAGSIYGYFDGKVPEEFWKLLALYIASNCIGSLPWAVAYGGNEVEVMTRQSTEVLEWYDGMTRDIPTWYEKYAPKT